MCLFFAGVRELPLVGSKIHFIDELIVFFMVSMLLRGDHGAERSSMNTFKNKTQMNKANHNKKSPTSPRLQRGLTTYAFATHQKKSAFMRLVFTTHSPLENTETLKQPP